MRVNRESESHLIGRLAAHHAQEPAPIAVLRRASSQLYDQLNKGSVVYSRVLLPVARTDCRSAPESRWAQAFAGYIASARTSSENTSPRNGSPLTFVGPHDGPDAGKSWGDFRRPGGRKLTFPGPAACHVPTGDRGGCLSAQKRRSTPGMDCMAFHGTNGNIRRNNRRPGPVRTIVKSEINCRSRVARRGLAVQRTTRRGVPRVGRRTKGLRTTDPGAVVVAVPPHVLS